MGFEGLEIGFKVGYGNKHGNRNTSKGQPKKMVIKIKVGVNLCIAQKKWSLLRSLQMENPIKSSIVDVAPGHKRKQSEKLIREGTDVKGEKKQKIVENEQGVVLS